MKAGELMISEKPLLILKPSHDPTLTVE